STRSGSKVARIAASSTVDGMTSNASPACSSMLRRDRLCEARTTRNRSTIGLLHVARLFAFVHQLDDRGGRLLDGAPRHVDHRPAMTRAEAPRVSDLLGDAR